MKKLKCIWIFSDSIKGHEVQSQALANRLSNNVKLFHCAIRQPWLSFTPRILPRFGRNIIWKNDKPSISMPPSIIITCGRRMAAIGKYYKRQLKTKHIQILNPGDNLNKYDLVICPEHDGISGNNVITTKGSLHTISITSLAKIKCSAPTNKNIAIFMGNPGTKFFNNLDKLVIKIKNTYPNHIISICGSRRTPKNQAKNIRQSFKSANLVWLTEQDGENPYLKLLACSEVIIVTADSVNMLSEACATDKTVVAIGQDYVSKKHTRFLSSVENRLTDFSQQTEKTQPLKVMTDVVTQVIEKI